MGLDINELSLMAAILAGAKLTSSHNGWKLVCGTTTHSGSKLDSAAQLLMKRDLIRNVRRGQYGITAAGKLKLLRFDVSVTPKFLDRPLSDGGPLAASDDFPLINGGY